jgi:glycosyltransferase involved in cell wall biosynthesis
MRVSVIIPVYNAADFVEMAVESALQQEQTCQVVLVEDGSTDGSLDVCKQLDERYEKVILVRHSDGSNHGAGASRNLGIRMTDTPFVAFLDADDFYLEGRFSRAQELLESDAGIDGVYEPLGVYCQDDDSRRVWDEKGDGELSMLHELVSPEKLFDVLVEIRSSSFTLDGMVVRKSAFWRDDPFNEELRLHQDTVMMIQLSYYARLVPGRFDEPVAMRRVHPGNRYLSSTSLHRTWMRMWDVLFTWSLQENLPDIRSAKILRNALYMRYLVCTGRFSVNRPSPSVLPGLLRRIVTHPKLTLLALKEHRRRRRLSRE